MRCSRTMQCRRRGGFACAASRLIGHFCEMGTRWSGHNGCRRPCPIIRRWEKRVSIARAIIWDAPIILSGEEKSALSPLDDGAVKFYPAPCKNNQVTFVIAYRLPMMREVDAIVVMKSRRVKEKAIHDNLMAKEGLYERMWRAQVSSLYSFLALISPRRLNARMYGPFLIPDHQPGVAVPGNPFSFKAKGYFCSWRMVVTLTHGGSDDISSIKGAQPMIWMLHLGLCRNMLNRVHTDERSDSTMEEALR